MREEFQAIGFLWCPRFSGPPVLPNYTVASLPGSPGTGAIALATNGRKPSEGGGAGTGVEVFYDGSFVVRTGDSTLLVVESDGHTFTHDDVGRRFGSAGAAHKVWQKLPA